MRIPSGKTDQYIYFVGYDSTDHTTRKTGLSGFTVYRSRNNGAATAYTTPTVSELSAANMPGLYALLIDEDTTIAAGSDNEEYTVHITVSGMDPVTRAIELYRREVTSGDTLTTSSGVASVDVSKINGVSTSSVTTVNANVGTTQPVNYTGTGASALVKSDMVDVAGSAVSTSSAQLGVNVVTNGDKTGYALTSGERNSVADALLDRDMSLGADNGSTTVRTVRQALRALRNKWAIVSGTATIYKEDDTTASWTSTVTTTADTSPVTSSDPAGP